MRRPPLGAPCRLPRRRPLAHLLALLLWGGAPLAAPAQPAEDLPAPVLRASPQLDEALPDATRGERPVFVRGEQLSGRPDIEATIEGRAELRRADTVIHADRLHYDVPQDRARASGHVRINSAGDRYEGTLLDLEVDAFRGFFSDARYRFLETGAHGEAQRVDFLDRERSVVHQASYTTCQRDDEASWQPDWVLRARRIEIDRAEDVGYAEAGVLEFKGVPILPVPAITFPLSSRRKSGLLPPTLGVDSVSGMEYAQPYYWNIAPNRDATITPILMTRRGAALSGEFRYLESRYEGEVGGLTMPSDHLRQRHRWSWRARHGALLYTPVGDVGLNLNVRRVSDDDYWRDFTLRGAGGLGGNTLQNQLAERLLPGEASLRWSGGEHTVSAQALKWQTLQDPLAPIVPPYDRLPQLHWRFAPAQLPAGLDASVDADYTHFSADRRWYTQPNARRSYTVAQLSRPFLAPAGFITPRVQLHATRYEFDSPLLNGQRSASRTLPTFSLDSGLVFEREASFLGRGFLQTLEPRAFYTWTPYRDQSLLPVYDTAATDFNFATVYTENAFGGHDRLADSNLLTLGVTTRLLDPDTGAEAVRLGAAQRLRFSDQRVTMPGADPVSERLSDVLLGAGINWTPEWGLDTTVQYNPKTRRSLRTTIGARYSPGPYRTVSAAYRMQEVTDLITEPSRQLDVGWQWPLSGLWGGDSGLPSRDAGRWYSVGRLNYSLKDRRVVDTVVGLEYESCCWVGRVVLERLQRSLDTSSTRVMVQLEFVGFSRLTLGANPLTSLRQNVPGYRYLREDATVPSRFTQYD
ncbi:LPS-assembly protein LptD [Melaminivora sp.]|uniref:LPS-assembly protein LptD n=1 Tax=Melaminivora sp. TaxID=1933032 RepID=UPI0028AFF251|nr:LPS-assembly protein LptD [Melaminivora sp.]